MFFTFCNDFIIICHQFNCSFFHIIKSLLWPDQSQPFRHKLLCFQVDELFLKKIWAYIKSCEKFFGFPRYEIFLFLRFWEYHLFLYLFALHLLLSIFCSNLMHQPSSFLYWWTHCHWRIAIYGTWVRNGNCFLTQVS